MSDEGTFIVGEISEDTGEVMLSAADVVAWLRECSEARTGRCCGDYVGQMADMLAGHWIDASAEAMERGR